MYVYRITNNINGKMYVGITNNVKKRWENERSYPKNADRRQVIQCAIHKYGKENFLFEVLYRGLSVEEAIETEERLIKEFNTLVPNGYNVSPGGLYNPQGAAMDGAINGRALLTQEEAQYIKDNRNQPAYVLYDQFSDKISYEAFKKCYDGLTYKNLTTTTDPYPYNLEFSCQFTASPLEYDEVIDLRERYSRGEYWRKVFEDYKDRYKNEWSFWNAYNGNHYKLVMPEVFTEENKKLHASLARCGARNGRAKLTEEDVLTIRRLYKEGATTSELYKAYPQVSKVSVRDVINGKTWKHLL